MDLDDCRELMRHMEWADARVWAAALPAARDDARVRDCLYHLHTVQWAYLHIWRDRPPDIPEAATFEGLASIGAWARDYHREVTAYLDSLDAVAIVRPVRFPWAERLVERFGTAEAATFEQTILQVTSHTTYHRGQVNARLRELGAEPPLVDFIAWIWMGKPGAEWAGL